MLANHGGADAGGPRQTRKVEAVVTDKGRWLVRSTNRFHSNHCLEPRPFGKFRKGREVRHGPHSPPDQTSMGVIERVKEIVLVPPREIVFDLLMKVLFNSRIGFCLMAFECEEIVASLLQDLLGDVG